VNGKNPAKPPFSPQQSTDSKLTDSPISSDPAAQRAVTTDATPIGSGADPRSMPQSASPNLPDAQVDAANFWSAAATGKGEN